MSYGTVSNCNFTGNTATGTLSYGGAVYFNGEGTVSNCNFTGNNATYRVVQFTSILMVLCQIVILLATLQLVVMVVQFTPRVLVLCQIVILLATLQRVLTLGVVLFTWFLVLCQIVILLATLQRVLTLGVVLSF